MKSRKLIGFLLVLAQLCFISIGSAQRRRQSLSAQKAAAEKAWPLFFKSFRAAVGRRDRDALKKMMVSDFFFSGGGGDDNNDGDMRDDAFKYWDTPKVNAWRAFAQTLVKGAVAAPPETGNNGKKNPSRVAPPAARHEKNWRSARLDWIAYFAFRDGHWYCTSFSECCD